jgi:hypothetical protein
METPMRRHDENRILLTFALILIAGAAVGLLQWFGVLH